MKTPLSELSSDKVTPAVEQEMEKTLPEHHDAPDLDKHGYRIPVETGVELFDDEMPARLPFAYDEYDYPDQQQYDAPW